MHITDSRSGHELAAQAGANTSIKFCKHRSRVKLQQGLRTRCATAFSRVTWVALLVALIALAFASTGTAGAGAFVTFESGQVRPLALSPNGMRLFAVNTPDNRLEIFDITAAGLAPIGSVPVGLEPVAVAAHSDGEVWVVNHLSDSVSIVDVAATPPHVIRTLLVGDEPRDIVFAGSGGVDRAFITCAHRGQNSSVPLSDLTQPGIGRADVWVFDANDPGVGIGGTPVPGTPVVLFGDTPRALAVSPDRTTVYAAVFNSGNRTTTISEGAVCDTDEAHFADNTVQGPCMVNGVQMPGGLPLPHTNASGERRPETGLVVQFNGSHWVDRACAGGLHYGHVCSHDSDCPGSSCGRIWDNAVRFSLPDKDVFAIDANGNPPAETSAWSGVGTVLFNMATNPVTGKVYATNGDATNPTRFEGPGTFGASTVQGHLMEMRITVLDGTGVQPRHLNKHIDYSIRPAPDGVKDKSLATPLGLAVSSDGTTLYVAAFGSSAIGVFNTAQLEHDTFVPSSAGHIAVSGGGPSGVVLDEAHQRLYALTRFDNGIAVIDTTRGVEVDHRSLFNPEPPAVVNGRPFLYDARLTSSNGEAACASCHVFSDADGLAWDLGNPDGSVIDNPNPFREAELAPTPRTFHPMKGPMVTQTLHGLASDGPMHWRGDRTGGNDPGVDPLDAAAAFKKFNVAFQGLLGSTSALTDADMQAFTDFILQVTPPPNPIRALDNSLTPAQQAGRDFFFNVPTAGDAKCNTCHVLDPVKGFFGTDGFSSDPINFDLDFRTFKIPHMRNLYQQVGMFGMPAVPFIVDGNNGFTGDQIRGFGFLHDGSIDTIFRFFRLGSTTDPDRLSFDFPGGEEQQRQVEQFSLAFDSNLAPVVGQQVTLSTFMDSVHSIVPNRGLTNAIAATSARIDLLIARADAGECDLTVKGVVAGQERGWYRTPPRACCGAACDTHHSPVFVSDRGAEPPLTDADLRALAALPGQDLTYTCVPPGSGRRIGIDRDGDGILDRDEIDGCSNPADPSSQPVGDCDSSGQVTVGEIVTLVNIDLGNNDPSTCTYGLPAASAVDIGLIIKALNSALGNCS